MLYVFLHPPRRFACSDLRVGGVGLEQTEIIAVQRKFYGHDWSFAYQWLLVMSTQLIGFSMGGVAKRFLVSPPSMSACLLTSPVALPNDDGSLDHSLASESGHMRSFQYSSLSGLLWLSRQGNEP